MNRKFNIKKFILSVIIDIIDFFISLFVSNAALPFSKAIGIIWDIIQGFIAIKLFGKIGAVTFWEILDVTDAVDAFIPSLTLTFLINYFRGRK